MLIFLLQRHYGLTLNDTPFSDPELIQQHIDAGITLVDALNFMVEKYQLVRIDGPGFSPAEQSPLIQPRDLLRAQYATRQARRVAAVPGASVAATDNNPSV